MEDIIVDEPAPISVRSSKKQKFRRVGTKRDFSVYLFDWLVKALIIALLINIDFLLFISAGNFSVFSSGFTMVPETLFVMGAVFTLVLGLMFLISFSSFLQNVLTSTVVGFFVFVLLRQFALFDQSSFLVYLLAPYFGNDVALNFVDNSDVVVSVASAVVAYVFLVMAEKKNIAYFMGALFVVFLGILADEYFNRNNHQEYKTVYDNAFSKAERGKKFVYIMLPNATSLSYLEDMKEANSDVNKVEKVQNIMLGFFAKNGFKLYPNAFVQNDDAFMNAVRNLNNLSNDKEETFVASAVPMDGYWSFKNLNDEYIYLNENQLYGVFKRAKYKISAYKGRGIDLCSKNGVRNTDRCVEKINSPVSFANMRLSVVEKTQLLVVQWLDSTRLFKNMGTVYELLKAFTRPDNMPMVGVKSDSLYVVDTPQMLEQVSKDIVKDRGNQAYFVLLDLPSNMFVYNEYCKVKPTSQWLHMESLPWVVNKNLYSKRSAYLDQNACLYGKLEQFVDFLKKSGVWDETVIVIQGLSGADDLQNVKERQFVPDFKNKKLVTMAIRDPLKKNFVVGEEICEAPDILNQYLFRRGKCVEMKDLNVHSGAKKELKGMLDRYQITNQMTQNAIKYFDDWYKLWAAANKSAKGVIPLPVQKTPEQVLKQEKVAKMPTEAEAAEMFNEGLPDELLPPNEEVEKQAKMFEAEVVAEQEENPVNADEQSSEVEPKTEDAENKDIVVKEVEQETFVAEGEEKISAEAVEEEKQETQADVMEIVKDELAVQSLPVMAEEEPEKVVSKAPLMAREVAEQMEQKVESLKEKMKQDIAQVPVTDEKKE